MGEEEEQGEEGRGNVDWGRRHRREMTCGRRVGNKGGGQGVLGKWRRVRLKEKKERNKGERLKRRGVEGGEVV